jgi:hypothetical protein
MAMGSLRRDSRTVRAPVVACRGCGDSIYQLTLMAEKSLVSPEQYRTTPNPAVLWATQHNPAAVIRPPVILWEFLMPVGLLPPFTIQSFVISR